MTQDGFEGPERIAASLDALAEALLDERATHYPVAALSGFRTDGELFGRRISPHGPGMLTVHGLGRIVEFATAHRARPAGGADAAAELMARYGGGSTVRGKRLDAGVESAAEFQLPVTPERANEKLRPPFVPALAALAADRKMMRPEELATGSGIEARVLIPSVFHPLTVRGGAAALSGHLAEVAEELFGGADAAARRDLAVIAAALTEEIASAGVVFAGLAALTVDGRRTHASLVLSLAQSPLPASDLASRLAEARPQAEVWTVLIPAGPAVLLTESRTAPIPAALVAYGQRRWAVSSVVQAFLPLPDGESVLGVQLSTFQAEDWELYAETFARILESIRLGWDGVRVMPTPAEAPPEPAVAIPAQAAPAITESPEGTPVSVPPADFDPFGTPAPSAVPAQTGAEAALDPFAQTSPTAEAAPPPGKGTPVNVPPLDFDPFAPPVPAVDTVSAAPAAPGKGTPVRVPPADFDPFAPPAPAADTAPAAPGKGTPVNVPPPDFDPFAAPAPSAGSTQSSGTAVSVPPADFNPFGASSAPAAPSAPPTPAPAPKADPFGTVLTNEPQDPFGTVTKVSKPAVPTVPPPPAAPPTIPPAPTAPPTAGKATPVKVPPPDFDPFAPPTPGPSADEEPSTGKGTPVRIPPADFNPFAALAPPPSAPTAAPAPEPPANNPFG